MEFFEFKPVLYRRYVDDIFILSRSPAHHKMFLNYMNTYHASMHFTDDEEKENSLAFLDIRVLRESEFEKFATSVYRKSTFSGVFTNFYSFIHKSYKFGLIFTLLHRSFTICSDVEKFHQEINFLKTIFRKNSYPPSFIDRCVTIFQNKLLAKKSDCFDVPKKEVLIILPFLGKLSLEIRKRLGKIVSSRIPACQLKVIFQSPKRLRHLFTVKDRIPINLCSYILYRYKCQDCNVLYYGKTDRHFHVRACEHLGISHLTGAAYKTPQITAVSQHVTSSKHNADLLDFEIIGKERSRSSFKLLLKESLLIARDRPTLNKSIKSFPLELFNVQ